MTFFPPHSDPSALRQTYICPRRPPPSLCHHSFALMLWIQCLRAKSITVTQETQYVGDDDSQTSAHRSPKAVLNSDECIVMPSLVSYLLSTRRALLMKWRQGKQKWIRVHNFSSSLVLSSYSVTEIAAVVKAAVAGRVHPEGFCGESSNSADMDSLQNTPPKKNN